MSPTTGSGRRTSVRWRTPPQRCSHLPLARAVPSRDDETMIASSVLDLIGDTPLIRLKARQRGDRLRDPRQGGVPQPRPVGEGSRGALHHPRRRAAGRCCGPAGGSSRAPPATPASAWPWSPARWATRCHHRHPAHPEPGEEGRHPPDGRRAGRGGRRPLRRTPTTTCATPAGWPRNWRPRSRPARSGPTSSTTSPTARPTSTPPARRSGRRPAARIDGFICAVGTGGTLAGVADGAARAEARRRHRPRRSGRRGALRLLRARRAEGRGDLDQRGHRPGPHHRQPRGADGRLPLPRHRRGDDARDHRAGRTRGW